MKSRINLVTDNGLKAREFIAKCGLTSHFWIMTDLEPLSSSGIFLLDRLSKEHADNAIKTNSRVCLFENGIETFAFAVDHLQKELDVQNELNQTINTSEKLRTLVNLEVTDVVYHISWANSEFRFSEINPAFTKSTGLTKEQVEGKLVRDIIPEPSYSLVLEKYREAIREQKTVKWDEVTEYPTGKKYGEVSITPLIDENGNCSLLVGTVHDVTEKRLREK